MQMGFFDLERRYASLSGLGDPLQRFCTDASVHDGQMLEAVLRRPEEGGFGCVGRQCVPIGVVLMNLAYNLRRIEWLIRSKAFPFTRVTAPVRGAAQNDEENENGGRDLDKRRDASRW